MKDLYYISSGMMKEIIFSHLLIWCIKRRSIEREISEISNQEGEDYGE